LIYEINGPFFFGAADKFMEVIERVQGPVKTIILNMSKVPAMDATAIHAMNKLRKTCKTYKTKLILVGVQPQPYSALEKAGFIEKIGEDNVFESLEEALVRTV
jgi:SulP family sulfate permease